jgi:hypothetical protein
MKLPSRRDLIVDVERGSPGGFTLDAARLAKFFEGLGTSAPEDRLHAAKAVQEMMVVLDASDGAQQARKELRLIIDTADLNENRGSWRFR